MTEDEAKTKICCGPVGVIQALMLGNGKFTPDAPMVEHFSLCAGSGCMAWRWSGHLGVNPFDEHEIIAGPSYAFEPGESRPAFGFCGLAGRPE